MESKNKRRILFTKLLKPIKKFKEIEKYIFKKKFNSKYQKYKSNEIFFRHFACKFIYKKECHITIYFNDYLLFNKKEEYLSQLFNKGESIKHLIEYALIYKDYSSFYCFPIITNFYFNEINIKRREAQAEQFYDNHFKEFKNKKDSSKDNGIIIYSKEKCINDSESKDEIIDKSIFNQKIRNQIDLYSPNKIECSNVNTKENSLFISSTNENNINKLINELSNKESQKNINIDSIKQNNNNSTPYFRHIKIKKINEPNNLRKLDEISPNLKDKKNTNSNYNNYIYKYDEKNHNDFYKKKKNDSIKYINSFFSKNKNYKNLFCLSKNKSNINIHQNSSLEKAMNLNGRNINSIESKSRNEKSISNEKLYFFKNYIKNNQNRKEKAIKTPNGSLVLKLNKIIKKNNNIININIIKNKNGKSMIENQDDNYNSKYNENMDEESNSLRKLNNINKINEEKNKKKNNNIFSRNKHNSNSSRFFSTKKLFLINKLEKENKKNLSRHNNFIFNKIHPNSVIRKFVVKPKTNLIGKTISHSKHYFNNENFIKALNLSSINDYKTYKNKHEKTINLK